MSGILDELKEALNGLADSVQKDLAEIRQQKRAVQRLKEELYETVQGVQYVRDEHCLILSAPKVIIGNVDHNGHLLGEGGGSAVVLRANTIGIEGVGSPEVGGSIVARAASIRNSAVDPGPDGLENVVCGRSEIINQARGITLQSQNDKDCFVSPATAGTGIQLRSDTVVTVQATQPNKVRKAEIDALLARLEEDASTLSAASKEAKTSVESAMEKLQKLLDEHEQLGTTNAELSSDYHSMSDLHFQFTQQEATLCAALSRYIQGLSKEAECQRRITALKAMKKETDQQSANFETECTGAAISMLSESISMTSVDGDGNLRTNEGAGLFMHMPHVSLTAHDKEGTLMEDSFLAVNTQHITLATTNTQLDEEREKGDITAEGDVTITSKQVTIEAVDRELKDKKIEEKALTESGSFSIRAEQISAVATDTEGKATGGISLNAKDIKVAAMDVDKEKRTDKQLAADSQMVLLADKMFVGSSDKETKSQLVQVASDKVGVLATTTAEMQQGEAKAVVTLDGGNLTVGASANEINGDTTIKGKADIKGETTAPSGNFKALEAGSSFKSPNISDGMAAPAAGSAGKPSAKLQEEEAKKSEGESA